MPKSVWLAILGIVYMAVKEWFDTRRANQVAGKVSEVKQDLAVSNLQLSVHTDQTMTALDKMAEKVEEVHKATNSLTDRLVESTGKEQFAAGAKSVTDRQKLPE